MKRISLFLFLLFSISANALTYVDTMKSNDGYSSVNHIFDSAAFNSVNEIRDGDEIVNIENDGLLPNKTYTFSGSKKHPVTGEVFYSYSVTKAVSYGDNSIERNWQVNFVERPITFNITNTPTHEANMRVELNTGEIIENVAIENSTFTIPLKPGHFPYKLYNSTGQIYGKFQADDYLMIGYNASENLNLIDESQPVTFSTSLSWSAYIFSAPGLKIFHRETVRTVILNVPNGTYKIAYKNELGDLVYPQLNVNGEVYSANTEISLSGKVTILANGLDEIAFITVISQSGGGLD